jgi:hypothetical protein
MDSSSLSSFRSKENYCVVGELLFLLYKNGTSRVVTYFPTIYYQTKFKSPEISAGIFTHHTGSRVRCVAVSDCRELKFRCLGIKNLFQVAWI